MTEATQKLLHKAARAIEAGRVALAADYTEAAANRAYYAMFYAAQALLNERGLRFRKHGGVHKALGKHFAKTGLLDPRYHRWLIDAFNSRIAADYGIDETLTTDEVREMLEQAEEFLAAARRHVESSPVA